MIATLNTVDTATLHNSASFHRFEVFHSEHCACFNCSATFSPKQIVAWTDQELTALCPHCQMDAVIPSYNGTPTDIEALEALKQYAY